MKYTISSYTTSHQIANVLITLKKRSRLIQDFLQKYSPSPISTDKAHNLEAPISDTEFKKAIKDMKLGKAPDPDGLPLQYYKTFSHILKTQFLKTFQSLKSEKQIPTQLLEAHITVIPKENKDESQVIN